MNINVGVLGLWHLGIVTACCLADKGVNVTGLDFDTNVINLLSSGKSPIYETGLDALLQKCIAEKKIKFSLVKENVFSKIDILWVTYDTLINEKDEADVDYVLNQIRKVAPFLNENIKIIISSQMAVGSTNALRKELQGKYGRKFIIAYSPENLRLGNSLECFQNPDRIVVGVNESEKVEWEFFFSFLGDRIEWMDVCSAEMVKHAINSFLAMSVVFANEIAEICEYVGANAKLVERGLKTEQRIGEKAYIRPGSAYAGGTLARDVKFLINIEKKIGRKDDFFTSIEKANNYHKTWVIRKIEKCLNGDMQGKIVGILGLAYKPGTSTLRRSWSVGLCKQLTSRGVKVRAFDPQISSLAGTEIDGKVLLMNKAEDVFINAEMIIVATNCSEFKSIDTDNDLGMLGNNIIDVNGFLGSIFKDKSRYNYISVGGV